MRHPVNSWSSKTIGAFRNWRKNNPFGHRGFDYYVPRGTEVYAVGSGEVIGIGSNMDRQIGFGHNLTIRHDNGWTTLYAHLDRAPFVGRGARVREGQLIGVAGDSGNAWAVGVHVHHQLWVSTALVDANLRDPLAYYGATSAAAGTITPITNGEPDMDATQDRRLTNLETMVAELHQVWAPGKVGVRFDGAFVSIVKETLDKVRDLWWNVLPGIPNVKEDGPVFARVKWGWQNSDAILAQLGKLGQPTVDQAALVEKLAPMLLAQAGKLSADTVHQIAVAMVDEHRRRLEG